MMKTAALLGVLLAAVACYESPNDQRRIIKNALGITETAPDASVVEDGFTLSLSDEPVLLGFDFSAFDPALFVNNSDESECEEGFGSLVIRLQSHIQLAYETIYVDCGVVVDAGE